MMQRTFITDALHTLTCPSAAYHMSAWSAAVQPISNPFSEAASRYLKSLSKVLDSGNSILGRLAIQTPTFPRLPTYCLITPQPILPPAFPVG